MNLLKKKLKSIINVYRCDSTIVWSPHSWCGKPRASFPAVQLRMHLFEPSHRVPARLHSYELSVGCKNLPWFVFPCIKQIQKSTYPEIKHQTAVTIPTDFPLSAHVETGPCPAKRRSELSPVVFCSRKHKKCLKVQSILDWHILVS